MILSYNTVTLGIDIFISLISIVITMTMSIVGGCPGPGSADNTIFIVNTLMCGCCRSGRGRPSPGPITLIPVFVLTVWRTKERSRGVNYYASVANVLNNDVDNEHMESCFVKKVESKDLSIFSYLD